MDRPFYYRLVQKQPVAIDPMASLNGTTYTFHGVAQTSFFTDREIKVSTVFLALDHNPTMEGPPLLFETMIFGGRFDNYCERYSTWDEAIKGHMKALVLVQAEL